LGSAEDQGGPDHKRKEAQPDQRAKREIEGLSNAHEFGRGRVGESWQSVRGPRTIRGPGETREGKESDAAPWVERDAVECEKNTRPTVPGRTLQRG